MLELYISPILTELHKVLLTQQNMDPLKSSEVYYRLLHARDGDDSDHGREM